MTRGAENVLFSYIYCNGDKGVYVSPLDSYTRFSSGHLHWRVMSNFYRCVQNMQAMFQWDDSEAIRVSHTFHLSMSVFYLIQVFISARITFMVVRFLLFFFIIGANAIEL